MTRKSSAEKPRAIAAQRASVRIGTFICAGTALSAAVTLGCAWPRKPPPTPAPVSPPARTCQQPREAQERAIALTSHLDAPEIVPTDGDPTVLELVPVEPIRTGESLQELEAMALAVNPTLRKLQHDAAAAWARARHVDKLPDPVLGANVFAAPIETAAGAQWGVLSISQMIPWLKRLDAQARQACFEAMALQEMARAERLNVIGDLRSNWYRLYAIAKQIETTEANQQLLKTLIDSASATVATGNGSASDVRFGTVEYGRLEERLLILKQQTISTKSEINRVTGRSAESPVDVPSEVPTELPAWSHALLRQVAFEHQPEIAAAKIRSQATRWGIEVARLQRRPDVSLNTNWYTIDNNRPTTSAVDVGRDAWSIGAQMSIPIWHQKYDSIRREANRIHAASHASIDEVSLRYDSRLRDLWEQAKTFADTARLYDATIIPDAQQTLEVDLQSYANGTVEFDRVIEDFRTLLTMELGYHQAIGQLNVVLARIQQAVGTNLSTQAGEEVEITDGVL